MFGDFGKFLRNNDYLSIDKVSTASGRVVVEDVHISREGLALIMVEDQIHDLMKKIAQRKRDIRDLEHRQQEDIAALDRFNRVAEELKNFRPY